MVLKPDTPRIVPTTHSTPDQPKIPDRTHDAKMKTIAAIVMKTLRVLVSYMGNLDSRRY